MNKRKPTHPGVILKNHYLQPLGVSVTEVAEKLGISRKTLSSIINGRASVTSDIALRLAKAFNTSPELWLNLQQKYNLWEAARESTSWRSVSVFSWEPAMA